MGITLLFIKKQIKFNNKNFSWELLALKYLDKYLESRGYSGLDSTDIIQNNSLHYTKIVTNAIWNDKHFCKPGKVYYKFFKDVFESAFNEPYVRHKASVQYKFCTLMELIGVKYSSRSNNLITIVYDDLKIDDICKPDRMIIENNHMNHVIHFKKDIHNFYYDKKKYFYVFEYSKNTLNEALVDLVIHFKMDLSYEFGLIDNREHALAVLDLIEMIDY